MAQNSSLFSTPNNIHIHKIAQTSNPLEAVTLSLSTLYPSTIPVFGLMHCNKLKPIWSMSTLTSI